MNRFFAFGCSFTRYMWPTWADIIGTKFPDRYFNFAVTGMGNQFIFHSIIYAFQKYKINKDDLIIVCWTAPEREDRYKDGKWVPSHIWRSDELIEKIYDKRMQYIMTTNYILAVQKILEGFNFHFLTMRHLMTGDSPDINSLNADAFSIIRASFESFMPIGFEIHENRKDPVLKEFGLKDHHPLTSEHYEFTQSVFPEFNLNVDRNIIQECDEIIRDQIYLKEIPNPLFKIKMAQEFPRPYESPND